MASFRIFNIFFLCLLIIQTKCNDSESSEENETERDTKERIAQQYLNDIMETLEINLQWLLDLHFRDMEKASLVDQIDIKFQRKDIEKFLREITDKFHDWDYMNFKNQTLKRMVEVMITKDYGRLKDTNLEVMEETLEAAKALEYDLNICAYKNSEECELVYRDVQAKIVESESVDEILYYWKEWRDRAGEESLKGYKKFIELYQFVLKDYQNKNIVTNVTGLLLYDYDDDYIVDKVTASVAQLYSFYEQLHAHVRFILRQKYGDELVPEKEPIPDHILEKFLLEVELENPEIDYPFPNAKLSNLAELMHKKNFTPMKLFEEADEFFTSMNIPTALKDDWKDYALLKEDEGCTPTAVSLYTQKGIGFYYCNDVNFQNFLKVHREMFKVQTDLQTKKLPLPFRVTKTEAFVEGLSDAVQLSVSSPAYLHKIGLVDNDIPDPEKRINFLYLMAIRTMFNIQREFAGAKYYLDTVDRKSDQLSNCEFWQVQEKYVGSQPPVERKDSDFDFISMIYDDFETDLLDRVISKILSYKLYEGLCKKSGQYIKGSNDKFLDNCDFSGSEVAGKALSDLMQLGSSKKWQDLMLIITDDNNFEASSLLKYFEPLRIWLEENNKQNNVHVGWEFVNKCEKDK